MSIQDSDTPPGAGDYKLIVYRLDLLEKGQEALKEGQEKLEDRLDQILEALRKLPTCPNPGQCDVLARDLETVKEEYLEVSKRLRAIEDSKKVAEGVFSASKIWLYVVYTVAGSGVLKFIFDWYISIKK